MSTQTAPSGTLPHWDMSTVYPGLESPEFVAASAEVGTMLERLESTLGAAEAVEDQRSAGIADHFDGLIAATEAAGSLIFRNQAFVYGHLSVDTRNETAQARMSEIQIQMARMTKGMTRLTAWLGTVDPEALYAGSAKASGYRYQIERAQIEARHLMSALEEDLAAELGISGGSAWGKLQEDVSSQLLVPFARDGDEVEQLPMSEIRNLAMDADRDVRRRAYEAELAIWKHWETPVAAALNGVTGTHATLVTRRGWDTVLDEALHQNGIDRQTLDAMFAAAHDAFPDFRRYFRAKARALGLEQLAWWDLFAPLSAEDRVWTWDEGVDFVHEQFGSYSPRMRALAERAIADRWVDAEPRSGKVGGGFCMPILGDDASRILVNYTPAYDGVSTLAHELGHAYHNHCQRDVPALRRESTPMTLAETASTFCETILREAAIAGGTEDEQLSILEGSLQSASQVVVDITSRFRFEESVFARRSDRELSASEFSELMLTSQRETFGDGIAAETLHPYMWAVKSHYYSPGYAFYNYPYMFGLLFGLGLYAQYQTDPDGFRAKYDDLLASTGDADAATLARQFGIDIQTTEFWRASLDVVRQDIDRFEELVNRRLAARG